MEANSKQQISELPMPEEPLKSFREWFVIAVENRMINAKDSSFAIRLFKTARRTTFPGMELMSSV